MKKVMLILTALSFMFFVGTASAAPIYGDISFSSTPGGFDFDATDVYFSAPAEVDQVEGGFSTYFASGDEVDFISFTYAPSITVPQLMWSGTGSLDPALVSFTLNKVTTYFVGGSGMYFEGNGVISNSVEESYGKWSFSANKGIKTFSFSSSTSSVPEPGTLILLGSGLAGLALYRRRSIK